MPDAICGDGPVSDDDLKAVEKIKDDMRKMKGYKYRGYSKEELDAIITWYAHTHGYADPLSIAAEYLDDKAIVHLAQPLIKHKLQAQKDEIVSKLEREIEGTHIREKANMQPRIPLEMQRCTIKHCIDTINNT